MAFIRLHQLSVFLISLLSLVFFSFEANAQTYTPGSLHLGPFWSPNGQNIAFSAAYGDKGYNIHTVNLWSGETIQVSNHPANDLYASWSPNGQNIAFFSDRENTIGPFPPDTIVYKVKGLYETYVRDGYRPSWSPDGHTIVAHFRSEKGNYEIYTMNRHGRDRVPITDNMATDVRPRYSPDGSKIVFVTDRDYQPEIYVMDPDGSNQTRLTNSSSYDLDPIWSPDGEKIAFISNRTGFFDVFVMNVDGSNKVRLTDSPAFDVSPVWSPDGEKILFSSNRHGSFNLFVMDTDGENIKQLTFTDSHEYYGSWSPDGYRIAYMSNEHGEPQVYVMMADGSRKRQLTR